MPIPVVQMFAILSTMLHIWLPRTRDKRSVSLACGRQTRTYESSCWQVTEHTGGTYGQVTYNSVQQDVTWQGAAI